MRFILNMASGENITDESGYVFDQSRKTHLNEAKKTLQEPQTRLAMAEAASTTSERPSLAGIGIEALIQAIED